MQKKTKIVAAVTAPCMLLATNLFAGLTTTLDLSPSGYRDSNSQGGEFTAIVTGGPNNFVANYNSKATATVGGTTGFETFCIEISASFNPSSTYNTTVSPVMNTGPGTTAFISVGTAYLYSQFAQGKLANFTYSSSGTGRELSGDQLQDAIWYLQGEIGSSGNGLTSDGLYTFSASTDPFVTLVDTMFGASTATESDLLYGNIFGVQALNLTSTGQDGKTVYNQDQLVYCPVPEPSTFAAGAALLLPLGLSAVRMLRKKSE
jgi:hypothetical protein